MTRPTPQQYKKAAKLLEDKQTSYCCYALQMVGATCDHLKSVFYEDIEKFCGERYNEIPGSAWMTYGLDIDDFQDSRDFRVLALCFLAAAGKDLP